MDLNRNFPEFGSIAIKHCVEGEAQTTIDTIKRKVREHNEKSKPDNYRLFSPIAYAIGKNLIAMAKVNYPSVQEILSDETARGTNFFEKMKRKHNITIEELENASNQIFKRTGIHSKDLFFLGVIDKKLAFMPTVDLY